MTLQSFERLEADAQEERPVLVGLRPDGTRVPADGMSEGTRDQLFFALRLAAVEASSIAGKPMPLSSTTYWCNSTTTAVQQHSGFWQTWRRARRLYCLPITGMCGYVPRPWLRLRAFSPANRRR